MTDYTYKPSWVGDFLATLFFVALAVNVARFFSTTVGVLALVVAAIALPVWGYRLAGREVNLTADGFEFVDVFRTRRFRWRDAYYRYEPIHESSTGNGIIADAVVDCVKAIGRKLLRRRRHVRTTFSVCSREGRAFKLDVPDVPGLEAEIIAEIERTGDGETKPFSIDASGIRYRDNVLGFSELARVDVSDSVDVYRAGARMRWASVDLGSIHNLWLLVRQLLAYGAVVELSVDAPHDIQAAVARAKTSNAAMPSARVVER